MRLVVRGQETRAQQKGQEACTRQREPRTASSRGARDLRTAAGAKPRDSMGLEETRESDDETPQDAGKNSTRGRHTEVGPAGLEPATNGL